MYAVIANEYCAVCFQSIILDLASSAGSPPCWDGHGRKPTKSWFPMARPALWHVGGFLGRSSVDTLLQVDLKVGERGGYMSLG